MVLYANNKTMITPALWKCCIYSKGKYMIISDIENLKRLSIGEDKGCVVALHTEENDCTDGYSYTFLMVGGEIQNCNVILSEEEEIQTNIILRNKKYNFSKNT